MHENIGTYDAARVRSRNVQRQRNDRRITDDRRQIYAAAVHVGLVSFETNE